MSSLRSAVSPLLVIKSGKTVSADNMCVNKYIKWTMLKLLHNLGSCSRSQEVKHRYLFVPSSLENRVTVLACGGILEILSLFCNLCRNL